MPHALVRRPSPRLGDGVLTHIDRSPVDPALALRQWQTYVDALHSHGWATTEVEAAPDLPDSAFVEDTMVVYQDLAVISRMSSPSRAAETLAAASAVTALGYRVVTIEAPGEIDGGDVLKIGSDVYVGLGGRSNQAAVNQLAAALGPLGARVHGIPLTKVLHLKSGVTALPDGTVIGYEPLVDDPSAYERFMAVPEEGGAHVVLLDDSHLLMAASAPRTAEAFVAIGYEPVVVDISEFEKMEGCVTCLSVRLRRI